MVLPQFKSGFIEQFPYFKWGILNNSMCNLMFWVHFVLFVVFNLNNYILQVLADLLPDNDTELQIKVRSPRARWQKEKKV